ncbi:MAG: acyl-CoA dehydrogenase [Hellea sp.]|nr:acyl-CoA dehydrogenase [Hellea sp.]
MAMLLNEDEKMLAETAEGFFADKSPVKQLRTLRDNRDDTGYDKGLWQEMADMGFTGVLIDEEHGGVDMGFMAAGLIAEQMGKNLTASPFLSTGILAATALKQGGSKEQKAEWLPKIASGETIMALALEESRKHNPKATNMSAERSGNGFKLSGQKGMVIDGHVADQMIVVARTSGEAGEMDGLTLFLVDPRTNGVSVERTQMVDSRNSARIDFDDVEVNADAVLGEVDKGGEVLGAIVNAGRAAVAAELLGSGGEAFRQTTDYIRERKQFGVNVGSFQALQHRSAHLYSELENARSAVLMALTAMDTDAKSAELPVAMAKAKLGQVAKLAGLEGVQMHGGVGMTDEYDIGLYLKRIRVAQELFGDANYQMEQIATMKGY